MKANAKMSDFEPVIRLKVYGKMFISHVTIAVIEGDVMLHCSAILGSVIVLFLLVLLYTIIINLLWFNLEKPSPCSFPKLSLTIKEGEMLSLAIKPSETSHKVLRAEWNIADTFSSLSFAFWQIGKGKKKNAFLRKLLPSVVFDFPHERILFKRRRV